MDTYQIKPFEIDDMQYFLIYKSNNLMWVIIILLCGHNKVQYIYKIITEVIGINMEDF